MEDGNPSSIISSLLPPSLPKNHNYDTPVNILFHPYPIRVSYQEVRLLAPRLFDAYADQVDMVLHLGVAPTHTHYALERQAHRDGYDQYKDTEDQTLDAQDGPRYWPDLPAELQTSLDFDDVYDTWRSNLLRTPEMSSELKGLVVRRSDDAGHFVCDFMYYAMLAEYEKGRKNAKYQVEERPVIFLHVPGKGGPAHIKQGLIVTKTLIRSLADCWARSKEKSGRTNGSEESSCTDDRTNGF